MPLPPSGVVVGSYTALVEGWPCKGSFIYATQKRRVVLVRVKRAATSGRAALRAVASSLEDVTGFQVTRYSPARSSSCAPMWALIASRMPSASAWASSINCWSWRSSRIFTSSSLVLMLFTSLLSGGPRYCGGFVYFNGVAGSRAPVWNSAAVGVTCTLPGVTDGIPFRSCVVFLVSTFACPS